MTCNAYAMIVAESGCSTRPPLIPGRAFVFACFLLLAGLVPPVTFGPDARADSAWVSSAPDDFNGTGSWFSNTELDLAGGGIRLVRNPDWISKNAGPGPSARAFGSMAAVDGEGSTVLFGGTDWSIVMGDTWTYDLNDNKWHQKAPPSSPPERAVFAMATIYGDDRTVLFGGTENIWWWDTFLNDTWVYDLGEDQWYERRPAVHPSARYGHAMAGIDGTDKVVLFGGNCDAYSYTLSDETWVYDAGDDTWTLMAPTNFPIARYLHQMATIAGHDKVLLFG